MNPDQSFNPNESEVGILRIDSDWEFRLNHSDLGFIRIKNFFRINSDWKSRIESAWFGLIFNRITSNEFENFFRIDSDEFGLARKQISEWIGMNLIGSEWISIQNFYQSYFCCIVIKYM